MLARKCDRCGKFYKPYGHETVNAVKTVYRRKDGDLTGIKSYDLCPSCKTKLEYFLKNVDKLEGL